MRLSAAPVTVPSPRPGGVLRAGLGVEGTVTAMRKRLNFLAFALVATGAVTGCAGSSSSTTLDVVTQTPQSELDEAHANLAELTEQAQDNAGKALPVIGELLVKVATLDAENQKLQSELDGAKADLFRQARDTAGKVLPVVRELRDELATLDAENQKLQSELDATNAASVDLEAVNSD